MRSLDEPNKAYSLRTVEPKRATIDGTVGRRDVLGVLESHLDSEGFEKVSSAKSSTVMKKREASGTVIHYYKFPDQDTDEEEDHVDDDVPPAQKELKIEEANAQIDILRT